MTTLPDSLVRFQSELEAAIGREQARRRRRAPVLRVAVAAAAAAALAAGAFTTLPGDPGGQLVEPASAAERAAAALTAPPGSIVHVATVVEQSSPDGSRTGWTVESWQSTAPPYGVREIVTGADGEAIESATVDGVHQVYDARSNTVRVGAEARTPAPATAQPFRDQVLDLLRTGKLTQSGRATVGGRQTISFAWNDGHTRYEYTVEAGTYEPVRWRFAPADASSETTLSFETYEILRTDEATLDLTRLHPGARVEGRP